MRILKTKTFWVGLAWIIKGGITMYLSGDFASGGQDILIGLALITGRDALKKLESK